MAKPLLPDALWERVEPLLHPPPTPKRPDRPAAIGSTTACLTGILFVSRPASTGRTCPARWAAAAA